MSSTPESVPEPDAEALPQPAAEAAPPVIEPATDAAAVAIEAAAATNTLNPAECAQQLKQRFPALFGGAVKPLKLRIQVDIQQRAPGVFSKQALSAFFRRHTGSTSYLIAVSKAPQRIDLDGQPAGEISAEHRQIALDELARRRANQDSRRELEEQQRRNRAGLLRDFETTTLTRANFCALKGVAVDELDGLLEIARGEAAGRAQRAPAFDPRHDPRHERHRDGQREGQRDARHDPRRAGPPGPHGGGARPGPRPERGQAPRPPRPPRAG